jgi:hypothetical protein
LPRGIDHYSNDAVSLTEEEERRGVLPRALEEGRRDMHMDVEAVGVAASSASSVMIVLLRLPLVADATVAI